MEEKNIKVNEIITRLKNGELDSPNLLADYRIIISASLYTATEIETDLEVNYAKKWEEIRNSGEMTDKMAEMKGKQTDEWRDWQRAKNTTKTLIEVNRAINRKLKNLEVIFQEGQNY